MVIARVLAIVFILVAATAAAHPQASGDKGYLRSTIESYPDADKRSLLQYLDAARATADQAAASLAEGKSASLFAMMIAPFKERTSLSDFEQYMSALEEKQGKVISYEYRNQALLYTADSHSMSELQKAQCQIWYAVKTSKVDSDGVFLLVKTATEGDRHVVVSVSFPSYGSHVPAWLQKARPASL